MTRKGSVTGKSASNRIELTGRKIGRLEVLAPHRKEGIERLFYECRCECGNTCIIGAQNLRRGMTKSCGCLQKERVRQASLKHGMSHTSLHNTWMSMIQRCTDQNCRAYPDYGGRGIKVCDRWLTFENFLADMGLPPQKGLTLDRFPNNDGNYEPGNVRWATKKEQANNRRSSRILAFNGESMTIAQWEDRQGFRRGLINTRLQDGWTVERAITQKPRFDDS
ncbi:hypothetical protein [Burkholderia vietnamiensis]|uniref:hypothetical protein n=1 Tax=Burkholderia vietnamiensis TaxID=60552 RepID=UPI0015930E46|nr:hypothetical protein [Burkholderia vietnamiensis]